MTARSAGADNWLLLADPAWQPTGDEPPPVHAVVGLWPVAPDGVVGRFRANPDYRPAGADSPSDPLDAVLRLVTAGLARAEQLRSVLVDVLVDVALDGDGRPLVTRSPDGIACLVAVSGAPHRGRVPAAGWFRTGLDGVVDLLADGRDVLVNPGGPAPVRLTGGFLRDTASAGPGPSADPEPLPLVVRQDVELPVEELVTPVGPSGVNVKS